MTLRIRLSPERVHQKHHRLQCWLSTVCLPSWMPPTPGTSEVEAALRTPEKASLGTPHYAPTSQLLRRRKEVKMISD